MPYDQFLADQLRTIVRVYGHDIKEKHMFGGLCFMYKGKMAIGIIKNELVVRVVPTKYQLELEKEGVRPMDFTGKPMKEFIYVSLDSTSQLNYWVTLGIEHAKTKVKL